MGLVQHAALHAQGQHIIWQQLLIKVKDTFPGFPKSKGNAYKD
jgi:hypothetical protein